MVTTKSSPPQRNLEELLPTADLQKDWIELLERRRSTYRAKDGVQTENDFQFGIGFLRALYSAELINGGVRDDLRELLISPNIRR